MLCQCIIYSVSAATLNQRREENLILLAESNYSKLKRIVTFSRDKNKTHSGGNQIPDILFHFLCFFLITMGAWSEQIWSGCPIPSAESGFFVITAFAKGIK